MTGVPMSTVVGDRLAARLRRFARPAPVVAPLIASEALRCPRRIGFRLFGVKPDIEYTAEDKARFGDGDFIDAVCAEVLAIERDGRTQVPFHWLPLLALRGKADGGYRDEAMRPVVVECKSIGEKGFQRQTGYWSSTPAAPKPEWLLQAGLAACSPTIRAAFVHIVLVNNDTVGIEGVEPEVAEWLVGVDDPLDLPDWPVDVDGATGEIVAPTVRRMVLGEVWRLAGVLAQCEAGTLPARDVPGFGLVLVPPAADDRGDPWTCRYCPFQPSCARLSPYAVEGYGEMVA